MALKHANQGARHTGQRITWTRDDGPAQDFTGGELTGTITPVMGPAPGPKDIDGELTVVDNDGIFDWVYGETDVSEWGIFSVQFRVTYNDDPDDFDLSDPQEWEVKRAG